MILVPVAQPYALNSGICAEPDKPLPVGGRIDQQTGPFYIHGMAKGVPASLLPGDEPYRSEMLLFYDDPFRHCLSYEEKGDRLLFTVQMIGDGEWEK